MQKKKYTLEQIQELINENNQLLMNLDEDLKIVINLNDNPHLSKYNLLLIMANLSISCYSVYAFNKTFHNAFLPRCAHNDWTPKFFKEVTHYCITSTPSKATLEWCKLNFPQPGGMVNNVALAAAGLTLIYGVYTAYTIYNKGGATLKHNNKLIELFNQKYKINEEIIQLDQQKVLHIQNLIKSDLIPSLSLDQKLILLEVIEKYIN